MLCLLKLHSIKHAMFILAKSCVGVEYSNRRGLTQPKLYSCQPPQLFPKTFYFLTKIIWMEK